MLSDKPLRLAELEAQGEVNLEWVRRMQKISINYSPKINDKGKGQSFSHPLLLLNFPAGREIHGNSERSTLGAHMESRSKGCK